MAQTVISKNRPAVVGVAQKRAEILGMITRLQTNRPTKRNAFARHRDSDARVSSQPPSSRRPATSSRVSVAPQVDTVAALAEAVRDLGARLARMEDRLLTAVTVRRATKPPTEAPPPDATFCGRIKGQMLSDMLQLVTSNHMTGLFVIEGDLSTCRLYFDDGRICHAENESMKGEDAFFAAFGAQSGKYHFTEDIELPEEKTISAGTQYLVLEALRRMDEIHG